MLLKLSLLCKRFSDFLKKHWEYFALFLSGIVGYLVLRKKESRSETQTLRDDRDKQLENIDQIRKSERINEDAADRKLQHDIDSAKKEYDENKNLLQQRKKEQVNNIAKAGKDDPEYLAKKFSDATGFKIIKPEE